MKKTFKYILLFILVFSLFTVSAAAQKELVLIVDGEKLECDPLPVIVNDRVLIPARAVFENMGAEVEWDGDARLVTIRYEKIIIRMVIDEPLAYIGGKKVVLDSPPKILSDRTMIPLRFVGEAIGAEVEWDDATRTVTITSPKSTPEPTPTPTPKPTPAPTQKPDATPESTIEPTPKPTPSVYISDISFDAGRKYDTISFSASKTTAVSILRLTGPDRLVFDIQGAESDKKTGKFSDLSGCAVTEVRYASHSDGYVRIATDVLTEKPSFAYIDYEGETEIRIYKNVRPFSYIGTTASHIYLEDGAKIKYEETSDDGVYIFDVSGVTLDDYEMEIKDAKIEKIETLDNKLYVYANDKLLYDIGTSTLRLEHDTTEDEPDGDKPDTGEQIVVLDAGHGGSDPGAIGYDEDGEVVVKEKTLNLSIMKKVYKILLDNGIKVLVTRETDKFLELSQIAEFANDNNATLFVSIHNNAIEDKESAQNISGSMVLYSKESKDGRMLASNILTQMVKSTGSVNRGLIDGSGMAVIRLTEMPAVIVECGFVTHPDERESLMDEEYQQLLAEGIAKGIIKTLEEIK